MKEDAFKYDELLDKNQVVYDNPDGTKSIMRIYDILYRNNKNHKYNGTTPTFPKRDKNIQTKLHFNDYGDVKSVGGYYPIMYKQNRNDNPTKLGWLELISYFYSQYMTTNNLSMVETVEGNKLPCLYFVLMRELSSCVMEAKYIKNIQEGSGEKPIIHVVRIGDSGSDNTLTVEAMNDMATSKDTSYFVGESNKLPDTLVKIADNIRVYIDMVDSMAKGFKVNPTTENNITTAAKPEDIVLNPDAYGEGYVEAAKKSIAVT